jgi:HTH-type transcriptional regulator, glycine betaine synthesis regulator
MDTHPIHLESEAEPPGSTDEHAGLTELEAKSAPSRALTPAAKAAIAKAQDRFIATWGQMGSTWGISRTMAEVHALLYIAGTPLCTDEVMERLAISRGNASMSLRALVDWGLVTRVHKRGDRKEYFLGEGDPWAILRQVVLERMRREIHPVLAALGEIRDSTDPTLQAKLPADALDDHNARVDGMIELIKTIDDIGEKFLSLPHEQLRDLARLVHEMGMAESWRENMGLGDGKPEGKSDVKSGGKPGGASERGMS